MPRNFKRKPIVVFIPGIGDRTRAYEVFAAVWRLLGFEAHIVAFGWVDETARLETKMKAFLEAMGEIRASGHKDQPLHLIGISAGGTTAVDTLAARPELINKIITVCSPLDRMDNLHNALLAESIERTKADLLRMPAAQKQRILSVRALYDQVVKTNLSSVSGVKTLRLWTIWHAPTIFVALTFGAFRLRRFLK